MTGRHHSPLKCLTTPAHRQPHPARFAAGPAAVGARKVAARKGALSALRLDPHPTTRVPEGRCPA